MIRVTEIGWTARRLVHGACDATVVAALSRSLYLEIAGEIVWLGPPGSTLHARAIVADPPPRVDGATRIDAAFNLAAAREWRPRALVGPVSPEILARESRGLVAAVDRLAPSDGFGALLVKRRPAFPLDRAEGLARRFLESCARSDAATAAALGERLLGLGPGLTPAGDDLVGGAFFARRLLSLTDDPAADVAWREAAAQMRARARERTHPISAMLLGDLLDGSGHAPLHDLAEALANGDGQAGLFAAARLVSIGHSSGWDILTGVLGALGALPPRSWRPGGACRAHVE